MTIYEYYHAGHIIPAMGDALVLDVETIEQMTDGELIGLLRSFVHDGIDELRLAHYEKNPGKIREASTEDLRFLVKRPDTSKGTYYRARTQLKMRLAPPAMLPEDVDNQMPQGPDPGFVYLAYSSTDHLKIGKSRTPDERIRHFDTQMPVDVTLKHIFPCDDYTAAEKRLHEICDEWQVQGEWFDLPPKIVLEIKSIMQFQKGDFYFTKEFAPFVDYITPESN